MSSSSTQPWGRLPGSADAGPGTDWPAWHRDYDDPDSSLSRRRQVVQDRVRAFLDRRPGDLRVVSACAGDGRDLLEVLAGDPRSDRVSAVLIEADESLADRARAFAAGHGLHVEVLTGDAGATDAYVDAVPADLVMLCGVFGNVTAADVRATVAALPGMARPGATVIWTRGRFAGSEDVAPTISRWFEEEGCELTAYVEEGEEGFRVVEHVFRGAPEALTPGRRLFTFVR